MTMISYEGRKMVSYLFFKHSTLSPVHFMTSGWHFMAYTDNTTQGDGILQERLQDSTVS